MVKGEKNLKIVLDAMGGDNSLESTIPGAIDASREFYNIDIILVGDGDAILDAIHDSVKGIPERFSIVNTTDVISMDDHPIKSFLSKPNSSIAMGYKLLNAGIDGFCSAGNTGAMVVGAMNTLKAVEGVKRPAIGGLIPKLNGGYGLTLDIGANSNPKPTDLDKFSEIGSKYMKKMFGLTNPKVGLMNIGEEDHKGNLLIKTTHDLLKNNKNINFIGNIEGGDLFNDKADVIVCDGFTGNVVLKMVESFYDNTKDIISDNEFFNNLNYENVGGSPLLGIEGNVIIGHGSSSPLAIKNMIKMCYDLAK